MLAASLFLAICTDNVQAGLIPTFGAAAPSEEMRALAGDKSFASHRPAPVSDALRLSSELRRLLASGGLFSHGGARRPSTTTGASAPFASGAIFATPLDFSATAPPTGRVAEEQGLVPPLILAARPFHPPRKNG